jgi:hypothetical protein
MVNSSEYCRWAKRWRVNDCARQAPQATVHHHVIERVVDAGTIRTVEGSLMVVRVVVDVISWWLLRIARYTC